MAAPSDYVDDQTADYLDLLKVVVKQVNHAKSRRGALKKITSAMVPHISDWCAISIIENGELHQLAVTHTNAEKVKVAEELMDKYSSKMQPPSAYVEVLNTGNASIVNGITDKMLVAGAKTEEQLELMRAVELYSLMVYPVFSKGKVIGMLTLAWSEHRRKYAIRDMAFAEVLAGVAARAIATLS